jgi:hypothetical protein
MGRVSYRETLGSSLKVSRQETFFAAAEHCRTILESKQNVWVDHHP